MSDKADSIDFSDFRGFAEPLFVETSEGGRIFMLIGPSGSHIRLSPSAYHLLRQVQAGVSFATLAERAAGDTEAAVDESQVREAYERLIDKIDRIERKGRQGLSSQFWLRRRLIPAPWVGRISQRLTFLFHPLVALMALGFIGTSFYLLLGQGLKVDFASRDLAVGYLLFLGSLVVHELGHSTACARYGAPPHDIGFTMYLVYPAFYSDVTSAWQLRRWQRVVVDLGGTYLQFIVAGGFALVFLRTGDRSYEAAFALCWYGALFSLNPVFKFDGYWMLADALGVTNLASQPRRLLLYARNRLLGWRVDPLPWPWYVVAALVLYTPLTFLIWGFFVHALLPMVWRRTLAFPEQAVELIRAFGEPWKVVAGEHLLPFATAAFMLFIAWYVLVRLLRALLWRPVAGRVEAWWSARSAAAGAPPSASAGAEAAATDLAVGGERRRAV
jgi:putative peptide zinc metalloprotease protein